MSVPRHAGLTRRSAHTLRVCVRVHIGAFRSEADVSLPSSSSLLEALPELLELVDAPTVTRPWRASSPGGAPLPMAEPLADLSVNHGDVILLHPAEPVDAPIVRDAAEALVAQATGQGAAHALSAASVAGACAAAGALLPWVGIGWAALAGATTLVITALWQRRRGELVVPAALFAAVAAVSAVGGQDLWHPSAWAESGLASKTSLAWIAAAGLAAAALVTAGMRIVGVAGDRVTAALLTTCGLFAVAGAGLLVPGDPVAAVGSAALVTIIVAVSALPGMATSLAGLSVPRIPTAGQEMSVSDLHQPDVDARASRARALADGIAVGIAVVAVAGVVAVGSVGGWGAQLLALALAGATGLQAARFRPPVPAWCLSVVALVAAVVAAAGHSWVLGAIVAAATVTAPLWAGRVSRIEPTSAIWWERAELVAVVAVLPLAGWVSGLLAAIRGLG
ncbi:type VII secretion integral membrane protein EccD [Corynebacterium uterequi]|uniref:Type VII secretion integral membrane protein EccD n=1 Tax=Corynebacterium uterequi TaxID=1072256 RepID=A0A0G3HEL1_9CORY|nr:type VII secretion integral membrane protein EccD [Corynebacterium uterequi]AKK10408.1 type VII secretion integral membrane protein EccD [Corynebacterium uterequi]